MSTTEILFNSPALHSLKRAQLVQLCKRHNIKATGKNPDIIDRLKKHALTLPSDAPLHVAVRSEQPKFDQATDETGDDEDEDDGNEDAFCLNRGQRPSQMWEVVMDDISEESGSLQNTLSSMNTMGSMTSRCEFGTGASKGSVTSSIKALANSLGFNRSLVASSSSQDIDSITKSNVSMKSGISRSHRRIFSPHNRNDSAPAARESLLANAIPYNSIPQPRPSALPMTDSFTFTENEDHPSIDEPIPGFAGREGTEAEAGSTVRLVMAPFKSFAPTPPRLTPFVPDFDLIPPTPGGQTSVSRWPLSPLSSGPETMGGLYPSLNFSTIKDHEDHDVPMPGGLSPTRSTSKPGQASSPMTLTETNAKALLSPPRPEPFIFGSPNPRYSISNKDFHNAASSVLAEMNARLGLSANEGVGIDLLAGRKLGQGSMNQEDLMNYQFSAGASMEKRIEKEAGKRFEKVHEEEFKKMESIATHYAARRGNKDAPSAPLVEKKRKSNALGSGARRPSAMAQAANARRRSSTRVISAGARRKMQFPGGFSDNDGDIDADEEGDDQRRMSKKPRVSENPNTKDGDEKITGGSGQKVSIAPLPVKEEGEEKDGEQLRKEREAIKRRLQYNKAKRRSSMGRVSVGGGKPPLIPNQKPKGATSRFGFLNSAKSLVKSVWNRGAGGTSTAAPSAIPQVKVVTTAPTTKISTTVDPAEKKQNHVLKKSAPMKKLSGSDTRVSTSGQHLRVERATGATSSKVSDSRSRSPIPPYNTDGSVRSTTTTNTIRSSRDPSSIGVAGNSVKSTGRSSVNISSVGTRTSVSIAASSRVSSLGAKTSLARASTASRDSSAETKSRMRPSSTLYAPTASSLARMQQTVRPPAAVNGSTNKRIASGSSKDLKRALLSAGSPQVNSDAIEEESLKAAEEVVAVDTQPMPTVAPLSLSPSKIPIHVMSPRSKSGGIFSQPLVLPMSPSRDGDQTAVTINPITGILSPKRLIVTEEGDDDASKAAGPSRGATREPVKRNISGQRRPRISRSKVIAKLGAQRAAAVGSASGSTSSRMAPASKTRSSFGAAVVGGSSGLGRRSHGGTRLSGRGEKGVVMSAKKRARQSEYARRRSARIGEASSGVGRMDMDVDDDE